MAARAGKIFMVLIIISLLIAGLNVSNYGISQLTMEDRGAVLDVKFEGGDIVFTFLGKEYVFEQYKSRGWEDFYAYWQEIEDYLRKIWRIFEAVFLYEVE
ncbi:hypothetical protein SAMN02745221_01107 [Thermosyntropha lipolytica DSM 11003]|uniref:Uncharacterized protein n=1 Tax=Thermosyntropha lipolytica DSM 11003 TaxID=1123382 RepID=A0A1M5N705_9FIRM|nr:hypothetical protein [Thermosyntropha lipolytica]SHG85235.1 hypothetical protein SAMN02745221_01107 [Thermosyntropha lipolytica DSM 11003]